MRRPTLAALVLGHLAVSIVHGVAHARANVTLDPGGTVFVLIVITAAPLVGLAVTVRLPRTGAWIVAASMAGALVFGLVNHFIIQGTDHVTHVAAACRTLFATTATLLAVSELAAIAVAVRDAVLVGRTS